MRPFVMLIALAVLAAAPAHADEWSKTWTVKGVPALNLDADDARVEIRSWDRNEVSVRILTEKSVGVGERNDLRVSEKQNGDAVSVSVRRKHRTIRFVFQWRETTIEVRVPRHARLDVRTGDGVCDIAGVEGDVSLESGDGAIHAEDVNGHIRFHTSDGAIIGKGLAGELVAGTSDGRIEVFGTFAGLDLRTSDGRIVAGAGPGSEVRAPWDIRTQDGRISLRIPEGLAATLDARTEDGHVSMRTDATARGEVDSRAVRLDLNGGGNTIRVRSGDGSIRIERYQDGTGDGD